MYFTKGKQRAFELLMQQKPGFDRYQSGCLSLIHISTGLQGLFVKEAARLRDDGIPLKTAVKALERIRNSGRIFFTCLLYTSRCV